MMVLQRAKKLVRTLLSYQVVRYLCVGALAAGIHFTTLYVLTGILGVWYIFGTSLGFLLATTFGFILQKWWTFRNMQVRHLLFQVLAFFSVAMVTNLFLNNMLMYLLVDLFGVWYLASQAIVSSSIVSLNFFMYKHIFARITIRKQR